MAQRPYLQKLDQVYQLTKPIKLTKVIKQTCDQPI